MNNLEKLINYFETFPGVGARQAKRFAFHVLTMPETDSIELAKLITEIKNTVVECDSCHRFFSTSNNEKSCSICTSSNRSHKKLLIVERDSDIQAIERAGVYDGLYFVFGGTVPLLNNSSTSNRLRGGLLKATIETRITEGLNEVTIGFSINPDGENTARFVESIIGEMLKDKGIMISYLGRGLSTGSELEYADAETIKNAFKNRSVQH